MIVIGSMYLGIESCFEETLAYLLIIGGILSILSVLTRATVTEDTGKKGGGGGHRHDHEGGDQHHHHHHHQRHLWDENIEKRPPPSKKITWVQFLHGMISLIDAIWLVVTSVFVYRIYGMVELDNDASEMYCARTFYLFTFVYLTVVWTLLGVWILYIIVRAVFKTCFCLCAAGRGGGE